MKVTSSSPTKVISVTGLITAKHNESGNFNAHTQATKANLISTCHTVPLTITCAMSLDSDWEFLIISNL